MSETIEFVLRCRDMMSSMMPSVASSAHSAFNRINNDIAQTQQRMDAMARPIRLTADTSQLSRVSSMIGGAVGGAISGAVSNVLSNTQQFVSDSLAASMAYSAQVKSFEVLTGSAGAGREMADRLRELKQTTIMGASVYGNAQTLMGFGVGQNEIIDRLRQIGDIAMGDTQRMQSLTLAFAQVRAANKLAGNDLLQFINAGFNPLQVMSERWKEFGYTSAMSIGQLKDQMEKGNISALQISKAFELATAKGGKFYEMMGQIGDTSAGQMMKLKGNWAAMQIDVGNALMPIATQFMEAGAAALHWLNIAKSVPDTLRSEQLEMTSLVNSITQLNDESAVRGRMFDMLQAKYPDMFGYLDKERTSNEELLNVLHRVNDAYNQRIGAAASKLQADEIAKKLKDNEDLAILLRTNIDAIKATGGLSDPIALSMKVYKDPGMLLSIWGNDIASMQEQIDQLNRQHRVLETESVQANTKVTADKWVAQMRLADAIYSDMSQQKERWGNNTAANMVKAAELRKYVHDVRVEMMGQAHPTEWLAGRDWTVFEKLMAGKSAKEQIANAVDGTTSKISGGGQKQIHINFRNVVENMPITVEGGKDVVAEIEPKLEEAMNRIFKSAP